MLPYRHVPLDQVLAAPHVVDEHIQSPLLLLDAPHQGAHLFRLQVIDTDGDAVPADLINELGRLLDRLGTVVLRAPPSRSAPCYVDCRPGGAAELDGYPAPGPARPPGYQGNLTFQLKCHMNLLPAPLQDTSESSMHRRDPRYPRGRTRMPIARRTSKTVHHSAKDRDTTLSRSGLAVIRSPFNTWLHDSVPARSLWVCQII